MFSLAVKKYCLAIAALLRMCGDVKTQMYQWTHGQVCGAGSFQQSLTCHTGKYK